MSNRVIDCQRCGPDDEGCMTCGGYKIVLSQYACSHCGHKRWERPGAFTVYEGKTYYSADGVKVTYTTLSSTECAFCPQTAQVSDDE